MRGLTREAKNKLLKVCLARKCTRIAAYNRARCYIRRWLGSLLKPENFSFPCQS